MLRFQRPDFFQRVKLAKSRCSLRQFNPRHFGFGVNVNIGTESARGIESADANEADLRPMTIIAPEGNVALWAAVDFMRSERARHRNGPQPASQNPDRRGFDDGVEHESAAGVPLAIGAVAAVHRHWLVQQFIANLPAGATATEFFSCALCALFHV